MISVKVRNRATSGRRVYHNELREESGLPFGSRWRVSSKRETSAKNEGAGGVNPRSTRSSMRRIQVDDAHTKSVS